MSRRARISLIVLIVALLAGTTPFQQRLNYYRYDPRAAKLGFGYTELIPSEDRAATNLLFDMSLQFTGAAAMGMREAVAGLLWVRADEFFHSGEYDAILPLVRMVTWLDPHQLDVYSTGAWHLDYNFTDSDERSDRRYIAPAIALMKEGIRNNPDVWDLYFDLGWMHYLQKLKDHRNAALWIGRASAKPGKDINTGKEIPRPGFVDRMLAHAYEKDGKLDKAIRQWEKALKYVEETYERKDEHSSTYQEVDVSKKNLALLHLRRAWRYGDMDSYKRGLEILTTLKQMDPRQKIAYESAKKDYERLKASGKAPRDVDPPIDAKFSVTWKKVKPKVLKIEGTLALVPAEAYKGLRSEAYTFWFKENSELPPERQAKWQDGCRVNILLEDIDYNYGKVSESERFNWEVDKNLTVMVDDVMVRNGKFSTTIDMSRDPSIYPFAKDEYRLVFWFNPQNAPDYIQDRIGWCGEGLTDKKYLDTKTIPGVRMIRKEFILKKSDIL